MELKKKLNKKINEVLIVKDQIEKKTNERMKRKRKAKKVQACEARVTHVSGSV